MTQTVLSYAKPLKEAEENRRQSKWPFVLRVCHRRKIEKDE